MSTFDPFKDAVRSINDAVTNATKGITDATKTQPPATPAPPKPAAPSLVIVSGNDQSRARMFNDNSGIAKARFAPLSVALKGADGKPIVGVQVTWTVQVYWGQMAVSISAAGEILFGKDTVTVWTDANGAATLNELGGASAEAYYDDGSFNVIASYGDSTVTFDLKAKPEQATASILSGNNQSSPRIAEEGIPGGMAYFAPLVVKVLDASGQPKVGIPVVFSKGDDPNGLSLNLNPQDDQAVTLSTDANGIATLNLLSGNGHQTGVMAYYGTGTFGVYATPNGAPPLRFALTVTS